VVQRVGMAAFSMFAASSAGLALELALFLDGLGNEMVVEYMSEKRVQSTTTLQWDREKRVQSTTTLQWDRSAFTMGFRCFGERYGSQSRSVATKQTKKQQFSSHLHSHSPLLHNIQMNLIHSTLKNINQTSRRRRLPLPGRM